MQRRDFLYSLAIFPGAASAQTAAQNIDITEEIRRKMDALAPADGRGNQAPARNRT